MNTKLLSLVAAFSLSVSALAQTPEQQTKINEIKEKLKDHPGVELIVKESRMNREKKKYSFAYGFGFFHARESRMFEAGYFLNPDELISLRYVRSAFNDGPYSEDTYGTNPKRIHNFGINYRSFKGNSFFINLAANYRTFDDEGYSFRDVFRSQRTKVAGTYKALSVSGGIGNQWQWKNFTLGVEWVGANYVISEFENTTRFTGYNEVTSSGLNLLSLYLGASF